MIENIVFGKNFKVVDPVNLYGCKFGNNCFVGPFTEIQKEVVIGNNVRIQSHTFICERVTIGDDTFIAHGVMFVNDKFKDGELSKDYLPTSIGKRCRVGSNTSILPVFVCDDVTIGAGSVVTKDIIYPGVYCGNPVRKI